MLTLNKSPKEVPTFVKRFFGMDHDHRAKQAIKRGKIDDSLGVMVPEDITHIFYAAFCSTKVLAYGQIGCGRQYQVCAVSNIQASSATLTFPDGTCRRGVSHDYIMRLDNRQYQKAKRVVQLVLKNQRQSLTKYEKCGSDTDESCDNNSNA